MSTYNPISQNNDDHFYNALCAYLRGEVNGIVPGTVGEEQAEIAKQLVHNNSSILDDKDRLLAEIATINYRESGIAERVLPLLRQHEDWTWRDPVNHLAWRSELAELDQ
jgi:hypothetical protein